MSELRQNMATKEWVIIAKERAKRPEDFKRKDDKGKADIKDKPSYSATCPFCIGNEKLTLEPVIEVKGDDGKWLVKVVPNKFFALSPDGSLKRTQDGVIRRMDGVGYHDVIIEAPVHNTTTALMPVSQVKEILKVYRAFYRMVEDDPRAAQVIIFKNHGESAGTSLEHPHSQVVATPIIPGDIRHRIEEAMIYFDDTGECVFCNMLNDELRLKERVVMESEHFVVIVPYAAMAPFQMWILPKEHASSYSHITDEQVDDLAPVLKKCLAKLYYGLGNPDYNYAIRTAPREMGNVSYLHWYISIIPRLTKAAGFEIGSGMFINVSLPENDTRFLREVDVEGLI
ncbi:MAG: galactose-1-phosphate uridylyltransferase [Chloroflexi bacterium]|nr:galactose-1-phosphate uridylyltransferase [Chloroflexota bacterium]